MDLHFEQASLGMDWLQFIASIVGAVAWPIAAVAIAWMFKRQISALLEKIRGLRWGDASVDLSDRLTELEAIAREPEKEFDPRPPESTEALQRKPVEDASTKAEPNTAAADISPARAPSLQAMNDALEREVREKATVRQQIDQAWLRIESRIRSLDEDDAIAAWSRLLPVEELLTLLRNHGSISRRLYALINEMLTIRSMARLGHASAIDAIRFENLAGQIEAEIDFKMKSRGTPPGD